MNKQNLLFSLIKNILVLFVVISVFSCKQENKNTNAAIVDSLNSKANASKNIIQLNMITTDETYQLSEVLINNFQNKHKNYSINLIKQNDLKNIKQSQLIISNSLPDTVENYVKIKLANDILVFIFNNNNPYIQTLVYQGATPEHLNNIFFTGKITNWSQIVNIDKASEPILIFRHKDNSDASHALKNFLKISENINVRGKILNNDDEILESVISNPLSIGLCSFNKAYSKDGKTKTQGIYILPIDINSNGIIGDEEHIYDRKDILLKAFKNGNYPQELSRNLYMFIPTSCKENVLKELVNWFLSEGQNYIEQFGLIPLSNDEINIEKAIIK